MTVLPNIPDVKPISIYIS